MMTGEKEKDMTEMMTVNTAVTTPVYTNVVLRAATNRIMKIGETVRKCAFETAYIMAQVDVSESYKDDGFDSVHDWAMKTFGFKKSASYTLLRIGKEYTRAISNDKGRITAYGSNLIAEDNGNDYTVSQIEKMLPGGHDLAAELTASEEITPAMPCKMIEKIIKAHTEPESGTEAEPESDTETEPENEATEIVYRIVYDENDVHYRVPVDILEQYAI